MSKLVIVLSRNYSTALGVIRGLGTAGYTVDLILTLRNKEQDQAIIATSSKFLRNSYVINGSRYNESVDEKILARLKGYIGTTEEPCMIFPVDDYSAMLMDKHREKLQTYFKMPFIEGGSAHELTRLMDKSLQAVMAKAAGLKTAMEWVIDLRKPIIPANMKYPCFVKPLQSMNGAKTELKRCDHKEELTAHLHNLASRNPERSILVQEFLHIDTEISMSGVCIDQEVILPAMIHKTRVAKHEVGVTLSGYLIPVDSVGKDTADAVINLLRSFHYVGMFDMELLNCNGEYYFGEVNLRSGGPNFAYLLNGINLPAIAAGAVFGECGENDDAVPGAVDANADAVSAPPDANAAAVSASPDANAAAPSVTFHKPFLYEKVAWEDYHNFFMSKKELNQALAECKDKILTWEEDPEPGRHFAKIMEESEQKERLKGFLKKNAGLQAVFQVQCKKQQTFIPEELFEKSRRNKTHYQKKGGRCTYVSSRKESLCETYRKSHSVEP